jgi:hypothetical protein
VAVGGVGDGVTGSIPSPVEFEFSGQLDVATDVRASPRRRDSNVAPEGVRKK